MRSRRIISLMLATALIAAAAMSAVFIIEYSGHDCAGDNCPVCVELRACMRTLGDIFAMLLAAFVGGYMILSAVRGIAVHMPHIGRLSPVILCDKITA